MLNTLGGEEVRAAIFGLPHLANWPEATALFPPVTAEDSLRLDWQLPVLACQAVGGAPRLALPAVAAIACLQISIILVDDILDADPRGAHHRLGTGRTANLALALQAASVALIAEAQAPPATRAAAMAALAKAAAATAYGQDLDVQNLQGEANYWHVVSAKSTPFYGAALQAGALLGGASPPLAQALYNFGVTFGEIVQLFDDLVDSMQQPANPDWREGRNNLALLYATTADHPQRSRLCELLGRVDDPALLAEAQGILISSGAVSYCLYQIIERHRAARRGLEGLALADPHPLLDLLAKQVQPLLEWLPAFTTVDRSALESAMR